jgi:hypothetical protein
VEQAREAELRKIIWSRLTSFAALRELSDRSGVSIAAIDGFLSAETLSYSAADQDALAAAVGYTGTGEGQ